MSARTAYATMILAAALALAACQKPAEKSAVAPAPAAMQPAPEAQPAAPASAPAPAAMSAAPAPKPAAPAPAAAKPKASTAMTAALAPKPKPAAPAPKPAAPAAMTAKPEPVATTSTPFSTTKCMACHAIDQDKVGPAWKTVVEKYGDAATLAKDFEGGFKERRVANSIAKWKSKEGLMTPQFDHLIKGHEKEAAHALFMTVKHGKFGSY